MNKLKVLVLSAEKREPDYSCVYNRLAEMFLVNVVVLNKDEQRNLRRSLKNISFSEYDRVFLDLRFSCVYRQVRFLRGLRGLLIYEQDACQNYIENSKWFGRFSKFYRALPNAKIVVTGFEVAERLRSEGLDIHFVPKGYDPENVYFENSERDIELGFIGRTASKVYEERKSLLETLEGEEGLQVLRTERGTQYRAMLNRIRYFVSADVGLGEYMAKNFEAMACGCVLLAWRQGRDEEAIGLKDGIHLLLYSNVHELKMLLDQLRKNQELAISIAEAGREFVKENLTHRHLADQLAVLLEPRWASHEGSSFWRFLWRR